MPRTLRNVSPPVHGGAWRPRSPLQAPLPSASFILCLHQPFPLKMSSFLLEAITVPFGRVSVFSLTLRPSPTASPWGEKPGKMVIYAVS